MKKTILIFVFLLSMIPFAMHAQDGIQKKEIKNQKGALAGETIYVHQSGSLFFTGEYLFYKVYCLNATTGAMSNRSKVGYVELVSDSGESIFLHKILLNKGLGHNDFFIPNSVPSGNYKLLAYTQIMKNAGLKSFYQSNISIVNPYLGNQAAILAEENGNAPNVVENSENVRSKANNIALILPKKIYGKREKVTLTTRNYAGLQRQGNYSISVRKIDEISHDPRPTAMEFRTNNFPSSNTANRGFLSEANGSVISGMVEHKSSENPASNKNVAISISGENFYFKVTTTDAQGNFKFSLAPYYDKDQAIIEVVEKDKDDFVLEITPWKSLEYSKLSFGNFQIDESMKDAIVQRSIYNQIENGYFSIKPDTVTIHSLEKPFIYYEKKFRYDLDDYTRFSTMEEVFTEIVTEAWTTKDPRVKKEIKVLDNKEVLPSDDDPLLFIDGVFVQDPETLLALNARLVQFVTVVQNKYQFGTQDYQGVILVETILGNYEHGGEGAYMERLSLFVPKENKKYFFQSYELAKGENSKRIPDFRSQLFWDPMVELNANETSIDFFTSDNLGTYEIVWEGFTSEGQAVSLRELFNVE